MFLNFASQGLFTFGSVTQVLDMAEASVGYYSNKNVSIIFYSKYLFGFQISDDCSSSKINSE